MADPSKNLPGEQAEGPSDPLRPASLDLEAGLAAAYGPITSLESKTDGSRSFYQPGTIVAEKFRLIEPIGEGGMGTVWYAEQTAPIKRKVALKLIKPGLDSRSVLARFDAERQALAMMDHPNIAKVFDGGITDRGHPYFVMELVKGTSLTAFCDERRLDLSERIGLFVSVCQAIQHAHQKGVIHRDIKPSNIMVGLYDGKPVPKVIDFGVAKAIGPSLTDVSLHTDFGAVVGTAEYMSPEQAELNNLDIDTRSDVYSLGVLMYELLAGSPPFPRDELKVKGLHEVLRVIREVDPQRPSVKLSTSKMRASIAALRGIEPDALGKQLRGDLDWIVMKSLEKDRARRYDSPQAIASDLERYLRDEPVDACPPSAWYRIRKFLRRYRWQAIGASLLLTTLIAGVIGTSLGFFRAESQRRVAVKAQKDALRQKEIAEKSEDATLESYRASTDDAIEKLIVSKAALSKQERAYLDGALKRWQAFADRQGDDERNRAIRAEAHFRVAMIWDTLGEVDRAMEEYALAAQLWDRLGNEFPERGLYRNESSRSRRNQATVSRQMHKFPEAEALLRTAIARQEKLVAEFPSSSKFRQELLRESNSLGVLLGQMGKDDEAAMILRRAVEMQQALVDEFPDIDEYRLSLAVCHLNHARQLRDLGEAGAETEFRLALENYERLAAKDPAVLLHRSGLASCLQDLGKLLANSGNHADAAEMMRRAVATMESLAADFPSAPEFRVTLANSHQNYGWILKDYLSKTAEAEIEYRTATAIREKLVADFPNVPGYRRGLGGSYFTLGYILSTQEKGVEARAEYLKSLAIREELATSFPMVPDHKIDLGWCCCNLGEMDLDAGNAADSKAWFDKAVQSGRAVFDEQPRSVDAQTLLQYSYRGRARARKILGDEGFQQDWSQALDLAPDDGQPQNRLLRANTLAEAERFENMLSEIESLVLLDSSSADSNKWTPVNWYNFACLFCAASENTPDRQQELADRSLEMLKKAVLSGFQDVDYMKRDKTLEAIRDREEFKQIVEELERTRKPDK
jgi:eukaryotic-like serine/threonine-protein kinase